jgi:hypothetical protein
MRINENLKLIPFALGLLCGGVIVTFALQAGSSGSLSRSSPESAAERTPGAHEGGLSESSQLPEARPVQRVPQDRVRLEPEARPELVNALEQLPADIPTKAQLESRYRDYSLPELKGAKKGLSRVVHEEAQSFIQQKLERGLFTTQILPLGAPREQAGTFPDGAPRSFREVWHTRDDGTAEVWIADIHPKEQPLLEARHAELAWLSARVHSLSQDGE